MRVKDSLTPINTVGALLRQYKLIELHYSFLLLNLANKHIVLNLVLHGKL